MVKRESINRGSKRKIENNFNIEEMKQNLKKGQGKRRIILSFVIMFVLTGFAYLYFTGPEFTKEEVKILRRFPTKNIEDLLAIIEVVNQYTSNNLFYVLFCFYYLYITMMSFAIPGPVVLSIISPQLFGAVNGFIINTVTVTSGAVGCYIMSKTLLRGIFINKFPQMMNDLYQKLKAEEDNLTYYMLFLRLTPTPNLLINVTSPIVGVPLLTYFISALFGQLPYTFMHIQIGLTLGDMTKIGISYDKVLWLTLFGFCMLIPTMCKKRIQKLEENKFNSRRNIEIKNIKKSQ